jgi:cytochrome b
VALLLGFYTDPESDAFKAHMLCGVLACWFLVVRFLLGFIGGRYLRWNKFFHGVRATLKYFGDALRWREVDFVGLNPGSAAFAAAIYLAAPVLVWTGFVLELAESWHSWIAWASVSLIAAHLLGLALHALRHRAVTPLAMIHGKVRGVDSEGLTHNAWRTGVALVALSIGLSWVLFWYFDFDSATLSVPLMPEIDFPIMQKG